MSREQSAENRNGYAGCRRWVGDVVVVPQSRGGVHLEDDAAALDKRKGGIGSNDVDTREPDSDRHGSCASLCEKLW